MDNRPVGIFDSGVGGMSAVRVLRGLLPGEDCIYFADTANVPYGTRDAEELCRLSVSAMGRLAERGVKAVLVACGTVSAPCLEAMRACAGIPVEGVIEPAARAALAGSRTGRIGVLATEATARSGAFTRAIRSLDPGAEVFACGNSRLVPLVERGLVSPELPEVAAAVAGALRPFEGTGMDTLILGCTHFPLLSEAFAAALGGSAALIDSGREGAQSCARLLRERDMLSGRRKGGALNCSVSGNAGAFAGAAGLFMPSAAGELRIEKA